MTMHNLFIGWILLSIVITKFTMEFLLLTNVNRVVLHA